MTWWNNFFVGIPIEEFSNRNEFVAFFFVRIVVYCTDYIDLFAVSFSGAFYESKHPVISRLYHRIKVGLVAFWDRHGSPLFVWQFGANRASQTDEFIAIGIYLSPAIRIETFC